MKRYFKCLAVLAFCIFSFYYTNRVIELSKYNDTIYASINEYALDNDYKCSEGNINEEGIILGISGLVVDKSKSYSNMKGIGFKKELIEYNQSECILNKKNNLDKYILGINEKKDSVSIVVNIEDGRYYKDMLDVSYDKEVELNLLMNKSFLERNIEEIENHSNILFKGNSETELNEFIKLLHDEIYCVKTNDFEIINICKKKKINSIKMNYEIKKKLLSNVKNTLKKGNIIFISENEVNLKEISATINYIKSKSINIVNINELLS